MIAGNIDLTQTIAANIRLARGDMSLSEVARRAGISDYREIRRYEAGKHQPRIERLAALAAALGRSVDWFLAPHCEGQL